jgi:epoxyqueuosine reductase
MPPKPDSLSKKLAESARWHGAALFGVADLTGAQAKKLGELPESLSGYPRAISVAVALAPKIVETCIDAPTRLYAFHYRVANTRLDAITFILSQILYSAGYSAQPIPASQITDWEKMTGSLSHRLVGYLAGHGYIGRSRLLVNPQYGARLRLATLLTDAPLPPDAPYSGGDCGDCRLCLAVCPASAIRETPEEHNLSACRAKLDYFQRHLVGQHICGVCVRVCAGKGG